MGKYKRIIGMVLGGRSDANIAFTDLCHLLAKIGFEMRISGSHHIFRLQGVEELINLQKDGDKAKPYQVRQVRNVLVKYRLGEQP